MVLPHQVSTSNIRQVQWKCQDCPMKRQWLWISLCKRPNTVNGVWWQFSLRKNEDITSTWLLQLTATSDMTALDHFITCCSLEHNHPHLSCTPLPTVLSLRGIFIHEENIRENIQLTDGTCCWPELTEFKLYRNSSHSLWVNHSKWQCCISKVIHQTQIQKLGGLLFRVQ